MNTTVSLIAQITKRAQRTTVSRAIDFVCAKHKVSAAAIASLRTHFDANPVVRTPIPLKRYDVHLTFAHPAWDEKNGYHYEVNAKSKSEANRHARRLASNDGHTIGTKVSFKATEIVAE